MKRLQHESSSTTAGRVRVSELKLECIKDRSSVRCCQCIGIFSREFRAGLSVELLYADDLVLMAENIVK